MGNDVVLPLSTVQSTVTANKAVKLFIYSSIFWLLFAMVIGLIVAIKAVDPNFLSTSYFFQKYFSYGRIRPIHTNSAFFGWLTTGFFGVMLYAIPQMLKAPIYSEKLAVWSAYLWNGVYALGVLTLFAGYQTGVEYAELPLVIDAPLVIIIAMLMYNIFRTVGQRKEKYLYVAMWYFLGSLVWLALTYIVGNFPFHVTNGIGQAAIYYFYVHNIIGVWFTPVGVGVVYYLLPKLTQKPIYSHKLSLIGFWTIGMIYTWNGPHHLINGPIPVWMMKAGIIPSIFMIIPVWSVLANVIGSMKGAWHKVATDVNLKMLLTGGLFYVLVSLQGSFQALMSPNALLHFTYWVIGHSHMALFAGFSLVLSSGIYYVIPRVLKKEIFSVRLMNWHYWFSVIGFLLFGFAMWIAGIMQGWMWIDGKQIGQAFVEVIINIRWALIMRIIGGTMMFLAQVFFAYNVYKTATQKEPETGRNPVPATSR